MRFGFTLAFALPHPDDDPAAFIDALHLGGCDDALIGVGKRGEIALAFLREGDTFEEVVLNARNVVEKAIPGVRWMGIIERD